MKSISQTSWPFIVFMSKSIKFPIKMVFQMTSKKDFMLRNTSQSLIKCFSWIPDVQPQKKPLLTIILKYSATVIIYTILQYSVKHFDLLNHFTFCIYVLHYIDKTYEATSFRLQPLSYGISILNIPLLKRCMSRFQVNTWIVDEEPNFMYHSDTS